MEQQNTDIQGIPGQTSAPGPPPDPQSQRPVPYRAQFSPERQQPTLQYPAAPAAQPSAVTTPPPEPLQQLPVTPVAEEKPSIRQRLSRVGMTPTIRKIAIVIVLLLLAGLGVAALAAWLANQQTGTPEDPVSSAISFDVQQLPLNEMGLGSLPSLQGTRKMSINGQLEVHNSLIIAPTGQPTGAVAGQIYYDQDSNILSYFNGIEFVEVSSTDETVSDLGGVSGSITVGQGLSSVGGQLTNTGVISLQTSGPLTNTGGQNPSVGFADGTAAGQFWQWDGDSWELATLPETQTPQPSTGDEIVGNEVTDVITGGGLIVRGSATAADPLKVSLEACALNEVLKSNGNGGWVCAPDAGGTTYSAGNGLNLDGAGTFSVNSPACGGTDKLRWTGSAFQCAPDVDTNTTYTAGTGLNLAGTTFSNTGTLSVTASGPVTSSGGQNPNLTFANGSANGQFWQWNGSAWALALLPGEQDSVVGNEVLDVTASKGLSRSGSGTALDPFTLGLQTCSDGQILKSNGGNWACGADGFDGSVSYGADGQGIELAGTTFSLELDSTSLGKSTSGLRLNTANANTWSATQTFGAGLVVSAGQSVTVNGDVVTDMTGTGLTVSGGALQTTLGVSVDLGSEVVGTLPTANGGTGLTSLGTAHQLLGVNGAGTALEYKDIGSLLGGGTGISVSGTNTVTISNSGVLSVVGNGPITSSGGQNPGITFADGTTNGHFWQWNGSAWALALLPGEQDAVIGNEVVGGTGGNSGLTRTGTGTGGNPYTLAVNTGNGLQVTSNAVGVSSPTCSGTDKLQWTGTAFVCSADVDNDTDTTYSTISNGGLRLVGTQFGLGICANGEVLKATAVSGEYACGADSNTTYTADGLGLESSGTTFGLELNGASLSKGASGLSLNVANTNTWSALQTFGAGATVSAGQALTVNGDAFTDLTGTGLTINTGSLQSTLGTSVDLTTEVVGTLPVGNGGTGLTSMGTAHQLLGVNAAGTALEYKNIASLLTAGTGISLSGTNNVTVNNTGVLNVTASGALTSSGGQSPNIAFANGSSTGQFWQWNGTAWALSTDIGTNVSCNVGGNFACMGGNTPSGTMTLGANNAQSLTLETNNNAVATIGTDGATTFKNSANSTTAFRILNAASAEMLSVDTTNSRVTLGKANGGVVAGAKMYIGDFGNAVGNLFIGEAGSTDSDILELHGLDGLSFSTTDTADTERMFIDDAGVNILGGGSAGGGGLLYFGDFGNAYIGEDGTGDTDILRLHGLVSVDFSQGLSEVKRLRLDTVGLTISDNIDTPTKQYRMRTNGGSLDFEAGGANLYFSNWSGADFTGTQYTGLIMYSGQSRIDVKSSYTYFTPTTNPAGNMVDFNRTTAGTILGFALSGTVQGSVSISGTTVSYNAFTGSHYTWSSQNLERGELVRMTGDNKSRPGQEDSAEPTYGVERTTIPNDPAVMGTYLGRTNPDLPFDQFDNANLVAAVGNGDMWVVDDGQDIQPGDFLISSDIAGHAMKDRGQYQTSYVVARAAQNVKWSGETQMINGRKHRKISVLYGSFQKTNLSAFQQGVWNGGLVASDTTFNGFVTLNGGVKFNGDATFDGNVAFNRNVTFSSNTAGTVKVPAGEKTVTVTFSRPHTEKPVVNITPEEFVGGSNYRVRDVAKDKFIIELSQAQASDVHFNWSALGASAN